VIRLFAAAFAVVMCVSTLLAAPLDSDGDEASRLPWFPLMRADTTQPPRRELMVVCSDILDRVMPRLSEIVAKKFRDQHKVVEARNLPPEVSAPKATLVYIYIGHPPDLTFKPTCLKNLSGLDAAVNEVATEPRSVPGSAICSPVASAPWCHPHKQYPSSASARYWYDDEPSTLSMYVFLCFKSYEDCEVDALAGLFALERVY
jgi:hypothetical protein